MPRFVLQLLWTVCARLEEVGTFLPLPLQNQSIFSITSGKVTSNKNAACTGVSVPTAVLAAWGACGQLG